MKIDNDDVINRINCYCHILNNIVGQMCAVESTKKLIDDTSALVSYVRTSGLGVKCSPQLKKFVLTRWNTVYDMIHTVSLNYTKIAQILLEKEEADNRSDVMNKLTAISRTDLEIIGLFLKKFKEWTKQLESEKKPTLWMVWPIFINLNKHLIELSTDSDTIKTMKAAGRNYIEKNLSDFEPQMIHKMATVLNPLLKNVALVSSEVRNNVYDEINNNIRKYESHRTNSENDDCATSRKIENISILNDFMGDFSLEPITSSTIGNRMEEFNLYLSAIIPPMEPYEFDLLGWWFGNRHTFPKLFNLFLSLAGITAASSPSERSFSETGIILTAHRASLLPDTVSDLVLARNMFMNFL